MTWWLVAAVVVLVVMGDGDPIDGARDLLARITRGARLTHAIYDAATGVVLDDPSDLASEAGLTMNANALARMISSEHGQDPPLVKAAVAAAAVNYAASVGKSIAAVLLKARDPAHDGFFGSQKDLEPGADGNEGDSDRYASTRFDPYQGDADIAVGVLDGTIGDVTGGATNFDVPKGEKDPQKIAENRARAGLVPRLVEGIDPDYLRFWGPA